MPTANDLIRVASLDVGYSRWADPQRGTKFGRWYASLTGNSWYGTNGVPYCAMAVSMWLNNAGIKAPGCPTAVCSQIVSHGKAQGRWRDRFSLTPGDLILFDWDGNGVADHVGIVSSSVPQGYRTIEGNTSSISNGNGGCVERKERPIGYVMGGVHPYFDEDKQKHTTLAVDGWIGYATVRELQRQLGTATDSVISGQSKYDAVSLPRLAAVSWGRGGSMCVWALQGMLVAAGLSVGANGADGYLGAKTIAALQKWLSARGFKTGKAGVLDETTAKALQQALNKELFL